MAKREFNPKSFLILFLSLSLTTLFLFLTSFYMTYAYSNLFGEEKFVKGVAVGPISLEGLTKEEARNLINSRIEKWKEEETVQLLYTNQKVKVDSEAWIFNVDDSLKNVSHQSASLVVELNEEVIRKSIADLQITGLESLLNEEMLFAHLKETGSALQTNTDIEINEFLTTFGQSEEVISEGSIKIPGEHLLLETWLQGLEGYEIKPGGTFSLQQAIEEKGMTAQDSIDLNVLASSIYMAIQKTNFTLVERHTSRELPPYTTLGYEAFVKPVDMDLSFQNPNATSYTLRFVVTEGTLTVSVIGVPLPYTYKIKIDKQVFKPKTIIHFNDQLANFLSSVVVNSGNEGYLSTVYRESYGAGGELVDSVKLAEDFYPPKHRIEERGYPVEEVEEPETTSPVGNYPPYPGYPYPTVPWDPTMPPLPNPSESATPVKEPDEAEKDMSEETKPPTKGGKENGGDGK